MRLTLGPFDVLEMYTVLSANFLATIHSIPLQGTHISHDSYITKQMNSIYASTPQTMLRILRIIFNEPSVRIVATLIPPRQLG
jgi:hypothetical protein